MSEYIHLKCAITDSQLKERIERHPQIVELQLFERDLTDPSRITRAVEQLLARQIKVYLHHPMTVNQQFLDILSTDSEVADYYSRSNALLHNLCQAYDLLCVVHPHYSRCQSGVIDITDAGILKRRTAALREAIGRQLGAGYDRFLWENAPFGLFSTQNERWIDQVVAPLGLPVCYDISHAFMGVKGSNSRLQANLAAAERYIRYFHVVDSAGTKVHDALPLGMGGIDWAALKPGILKRDFILEIDLEDYDDCSPMVASARYLQAL